MNFPLNREDLQRLPSQREEKELNEYIDKVVKLISETIVNLAYQGRTTYSHDHWTNKKLTQDNFETIARKLQENFPDVPLTKTFLDNGNLRVVFDWS